MWRVVVNQIILATALSVNFAWKRIYKFSLRHPGILVCPTGVGAAGAGSQVFGSNNTFNTQNGLQRLHQSFDPNNANIIHEFGDTVSAYNDSRTNLSLQRIDNKINQCERCNKTSKKNRWRWYRDEFEKYAIQGTVITLQNYAACFPDEPGLPSLGRMNYECATDVLDATNEEWKNIQKNEYLANSTAIAMMNRDIETLNDYWGWWANKHKNRNYYFHYDDNKYGIQTKKTQNKYIGKKRSTMNDDDNAPNTNTNNTLILPPIKRARFNASNTNNSFKFTPNNPQFPNFSNPNNSFKFTPNDPQFPNFSNPNITLIPNAQSPNQFTPQSMSFNPYALINKPIAPKGKLLTQRKSNRKKPSKKTGKPTTKTTTTTTETKQTKQLGQLEPAVSAIVQNHDQIGKIKFDKKASVLVTFYNMDKTIEDADKLQFLQSIHIREITNILFQHGAHYKTDKLQTGSTFTYNQIDTKTKYYTWIKQSKGKQLIEKKLNLNEDKSKEMTSLFAEKIKAYVKKVKKETETKKDAIPKLKKKKLAKKKRE